MMKVFKSFSVYLTNYLVHKGFKIIGQQPNKKAPQFDVYLFEDTPEVRKALTDFTAMRKAEKI